MTRWTRAWLAEHKRNARSGVFVIEPDPRYTKTKGAVVDTGEPRPLRRFSFVLPFPPSVNELYHTSRETGQKYLVDEQRAFRVTVSGIVLSTLCTVHGRVPPLTGRLKLSLTLYQAGGRHDTGNGLKAVEDALEHAFVFDDDEQIDVIHIERVKGCTEAACGVLVEEIAL